jgi:hypothetical protein
MIIYELDIPGRTNDGRSYFVQHAQFETYLLTIGGGYKRLATAIGAWRADEPDDQGRRDYVEEIVTYRVGCNNREQALLIVAHAKCLFSDQRAFALACIGTLEIVT